MGILEARLLGARTWFEETESMLVSVPLPARFAAVPWRFPPYLAMVENVRLLPTDWLLLSDAGGLLIETLHHTLVFSPWKTRYVRNILDSAATLSLPETETLVTEPCVLLGGSTSHYHWLVDYLPRVYTIKRFEHLRGMKIAVSAGLGAAQAESLQAAGIDESLLLRLDPDTLYRFEFLWVPSLFSDRIMLHPAAIAWLRDTYIGEAPAEPFSRLFVSRRDTALRQLINEEEVRTFAEAHGFETIIPGDLSFQEQVTRYAHAAAVIGITGSGMANIVFAPAAATVIELHNASQGADFIGNLAGQLGQRYMRLAGEAVADPALMPHNYNFRVPPDSLRSLLVGAF